LKEISNGITISAHEDKRFRFYDLNSYNGVYLIIVHQDAVTDLDIDSNNINLLSASHDSSIRLWNLGGNCPNNLWQNCILEITAHPKKYDHIIHCIGFHKKKTYIASGGADAIAIVYC
jgi:striatin 1/3/4